MWWVMVMMMSALTTRFTRHGRHGGGYIILGTLLVYIVTDKLRYGTTSHGIHKVGPLAAVHIRAGQALDGKALLIQFFRSFLIRY